VTAVEVQSQMAKAFEELKGIEVKLQKNIEEIIKALSKEQAALEALDEANRQLREFKGTSVIALAEFKEKRKTVNTFERFYDQSKALRVALQNEKIKLETTQRTVQKFYDSSGETLSKIENNIVSIS
jgi:chromosome segregation ATPase